MRTGACTSVGKRIGLVLAGCFLWSGLNANSGDETGAEVWIWGDEEVARGIVEVLEHADLRAFPVTEEQLGGISATAPSALVVAPGKKLPPDSRPALDDYRRAGGHFVFLDPGALNYRREMVSSVRPVDFSDEATFSIRRPQSSMVNPEPVVEVEALPPEDGRGAGLEVYTRLIGDGDVMVQVPLREHRAADRDMVGFRAKGSPDVRILTLWLDDEEGRRWVAFVELDFDWQSYTVPFADFLLAEESAEGTEKVNPEEVRTFSVGMVSRVLWPEVSGRFSVADLALGGAAEHAGIRTAEVGKWSVQYERLAIPFPAWAWDPFWGTEEIGSEVEIAFAGDGRPEEGVTSGSTWLAPLPPHERGRERTELEEILIRDEWTKRVLLTANGDNENRVVGKWIRQHGGDYAGSELVLAGLPDEDFSEGSPFGSFVADAVALVAARPKIVRVTPVLTEWDVERRGLICRVKVHNPSANELSARIAVDLADGHAVGEEEITVAAGESAAVDVLLPEIGTDFPFAKFGWRVALDKDGETLDVFEDRVDAEELLRVAAEYMLGLQKQHRDGRFSHHFFADHYAARFLLPYSEVLGKKGHTGRTERYREAALRFADMIAARQREDGAFPMGYGEHRNIIFVADLGQICLGLVHLASWLDSEDSRRTEYLNTVRRYLPFRQSFRQTPEKVAELEEKYGADPTRIREGFYGIGLLGSDYFDGGRWDGIRPEYRGRWWVTPVSMGFLGALARFEDDAAAHEIGREDLHVYLDDDFGVTAASYFHVESLFWMFDGIEDERLREKAYRRLAAELPPKVFVGKESLPFEFQGRASLWWLSLLYFHRYFDERPEFRSAFVKGLWLLGSDSSSHSVANVIEKYPQTTYGPSIGAFRYVSFSAFWVSELLEEGRTQLRDHSFSVEAAQRAAEGEATGSNR